MFDFETNATVKDLTTVPEQFRPLYAEDKAAGTYKLRTEDPVVKGAVEATVGLNRALKAERSISSDLKTKVVDLTPLGDYGKTPAEIAAAVKAKVEELQSKKVDVETIKAEVAKAAQAEISKKDEQNRILRKNLEDVIVDHEIQRAANEHDAVDAELIAPHVRNRIRIVEEDGKLQPRVFDEKGAPRFSASGNMTINEYVAELKTTTKFATLFKSKTPRGSAAPSGGSAGRVVPADGKLSSMDKIRSGMAARAAAR